MPIIGRLSGSHSFSEHFRSDDGLNRNYLTGDEGLLLNVQFTGFGGDISKDLGTILFMSNFISAIIVKMPQLIKNTFYGKSTTQILVA